MIYLIRAGQHGPVKLGFAEDVGRRLVKMQADNHERLTVIRILAGGIPEEKTLHLRFRHLHLHGEWLSFSRELMGDLGLAEMPLPAQQPMKETRAAEAREIIAVGCPSVEFGSRLRIARRACAMTQIELAKAINCNHSDISHYEHGHYQPTLARVSLIAKVLKTTGSFLMGETHGAAA